MGPSIRLATRGSRLALWQAERVKSILSLHVGSEIEIQIVVVQTRGDRDSTAPISEIGGQGIFVKEIQQVVLDGAADVAIHSAKDLPALTPEGLLLACVPERADPRDALVGKTLRELRPGQTVATGSPRRRAQLAWLRPDLTFTELRGSIETRIQKAVAIGAGVVAMAAVERLGMTDKIAYVFDTSEMLPQIAQGALAVECRSDDIEMVDLLRRVDDLAVRTAVEAERSYLAGLGGGCSVPVAGFATVSKDLPNEITLEAMVASHDGRVVLRRRSKGTDPQALGCRLAEEMMSEAGGQMLEPWA